MNRCEEQTSTRPVADAEGSSDTDVYRVLADEHRQRLLRFLDTVDESTIDELATVLSGWPATQENATVTETEYARAAIRVRHVHVPILDSAGLIDVTGETISLTDTGKTAVSRLDVPAN